jgi:signal peptidase I
VTSDPVEPDVPLDGDSGHDPQTPHSVPSAEEPASALVASIRGLLEWIVVLVLAVAVALFLRAFVLQAFWIESGSMETTLEIRDRVMINRLSYRIGDIVVFDRPDGLDGDTQDLIKRVIAIGGDVVEGRDGRIFLNDVPQDETYLDAGVTTSNFGPVEVPDGYVWVMGDNRGRSSDSRVFGPVPVDSIAGKSFVRFWPLDRLGTP